MVPTPCSWTFEKFQGHYTTQKAAPCRQMYPMEWWMLFSRCLCNFDLVITIIAIPKTI
jgi:hypothetical protein